MEDKRIKRQRIYKVIMLIILTAFITCMITTIVMYNKFETRFMNVGSTSSSENSGAENSIIKTLKLFKNVLSSKYIYDIDDSKLIDGALKGYIEGLGDPYTEYLTKEEMEAFTEEANSEYVGIGIYVSNIDNEICIVGVMKDSPALEAGIQAGDIIKKIDGVEYTEIT